MSNREKFNQELKKSDALFNDDIYLYENMVYITLGLDEFPKDKLRKALLMNEYFRSARDPKNCQYLPEEIFNDKVFLLNSIRRNPELYFIISKENKAIFRKTVVINNPQYLVCLDLEDYKDEHILGLLEKNLNGSSSLFKKMTEERFELFLSQEYCDRFEKYMLKVNESDCERFKVPLNKHLEKGKSEKGVEWLYERLIENPILYIALDKEKYKKQKDKEIILSFTHNYNQIFKYLPEEWTQDHDIIFKLLNSNASKAPLKGLSGNRGLSIDKHEARPDMILNEIKDIDSFLVRYSDKVGYSAAFKVIRDNYEDLNERWRSNNEVIKSLFKERDNFRASSSLCEKIPFIELSENLSDYVRRSDSMGFLRDIGEDLEKIVNHHYMKEKLSNVIIENIKRKKFKM